MNAIPAIVSRISCGKNSEMNDPKSTAKRVDSANASETPKKTRENT